MVSFIESGLNIKKLITHTFPYTEYEEGFKLLNNGAACKVILDWS
jgi:threonine 3-dehydrogenase